jgi:carboxylate-amine ligase
LKHPTLELRAPDCCTRLDDAIAIAALYRTLVRHLYRNPDHNADVGAVTRAIAVENKWRAQRYGVSGTFATEFGPVTVGGMLDRLIDRIAPDAEALGSTAEIERCRLIVADGSSADRQLKIFAEHEACSGKEPALKAVSEWIAATTLQV